MKTIKCFRHGVKQPEVIQDSSYVMFQKRKLSHRDYSEFILIGADSDNIYYNGHTVPIYPGVLSFKQSDRVLVLTCKEVELIYSSGLINQFDLLCLEQLFPFLHGIFYKSDAKSNYRTLVDKISKLRRYKIDFDLNDLGIDIELSFEDPAAVTCAQVSIVCLGITSDKLYCAF